MFYVEGCSISTLFAGILIGVFFMAIFLPSVQTVVGEKEVIIKTSWGEFTPRELIDMVAENKRLEKKIKEVELKNTLLEEIIKYDIPSPALSSYYGIQLINFISGLVTGLFGFKLFQKYFEIKRRTPENKKEA